MYPGITEKQLKRSRTMSVFQACLEYLIYSLVTTPFVAFLTTSLGFSDSLTGIISSVVTLGCLFQLGSLFLPAKNTKRRVILASAVYHSLYVLLYVIPLLSGNKDVKIGLFTGIIILGFLLYNVVYPRKYDWLLSLIRDEERGRFCSLKEITTIIPYLFFSLGMGALMDYFKAKGQINTAFILCGVVILILNILHTLVLIFTVETPIASSGSNIFANCKRVLADSRVRKLIGLFIFWNIANSIAIPFFGTYQIKELGFSMTLVSGIVMIANFARLLCSRMWGAYADKHSFASMVKICLALIAVSFLISAATVPANGLIFYTLHHVIYYAAMSGVDSALINLIFDYIPEQTRADALAICHAIGGLAGFVTAFLASLLVAHIQAAGNLFLGIPMYAQQAVSVLAFLAVIGCLLFIHFSFRKEQILRPR